jgi:hypothetical protein
VTGASSGKEIVTLSTGIPVTSLDAYSSIVLPIAA